MKARGEHSRGAGHYAGTRIRTVDVVGDKDVGDFLEGTGELKGPALVVVTEEIPIEEGEGGGKERE